MSSLDIQLAQVRLGQLDELLAPARMVTRPAAFSTCAAVASDSSSGRMTGDTVRNTAGCAPGGASAMNTSPGTTTTATPAPLQGRASNRPVPTLR